jgi:hypothetical protein
VGFRLERIGTSQDCRPSPFGTIEIAMSVSVPPTLRTGLFPVAAFWAVIQFTALAVATDFTVGLPLVSTNCVTDPPPPPIAESVPLGLTKWSVPSLLAYRQSFPEDGSRNSIAR